jgi:hypothetical protein
VHGFWPRKLNGVTEPKLTDGTIFLAERRVLDGTVTIPRSIEGVLILGIL